MTDNEMCSSSSNRVNVLILDLNGVIESSTQNNSFDTIWHGYNEKCVLKYIYPKKLGEIRILYTSN